MKSEILLTIMTIAVCLMAAISLLKLILGMISSEFKYAKITKTIVSGVYWVVFIILLNIPIVSCEYYNLIPFENGETMQLGNSEVSGDYFVFNYEKEGVVQSRYFYLHSIANSGSSYNYNEEKKSDRLESTWFGEEGFVDTVYEVLTATDRTENTITLFKSASLLQSVFNEASEFWKISTNASEVQRVYDIIERNLLSMDE